MSPLARRLAGTVCGLALVGGSGVAFATAAHADPNPNVTICHATGNPDKFVVITIDAAAITSQGHDTHQNDNDVIPPFEYVAENSQETVSFPGQNWDGNWETNGEGVATGEVDAADCGQPTHETPTPTPTPTVTVTSTSTSTPSKTATGPVVETDRVDPAGTGTNLGLVLGGTVLLLAGGATVAASRRRGSHS